MRCPRSILVLVSLLIWGTSLVADSKPAPPSQPAGTAAAPRPMSHETQLLVIRSLNSELAFASHVLPAGRKGMTIRNRQFVSPTQAEVNSLVETFGAAAKPGDRVQITKVDIKKDRIIFELNGGPQRKNKWYQHIEVSGVGGTVVPDQPPAPAAANPHGCVIALLFDTRFVPELTGDQVRQLLAPVLDFSSKSAVEAYLDTIPVKAKEAIKSHQILVGMNREMVNYAKGRPDKKIREKDQSGKEYEEWLYGEPPGEVQFVRFQGDEVIRLEIMPVDGQKIVRTEKEVDLSALVARKQAEAPPAAPTAAPTLRRPGEQPEQPQKPLPRGSVPEEGSAPPVLLPPDPPSQPQQ